MMQAAELAVLDWLQAHLRCDFLDAVMPWISRICDHGEIWILLAAVLLLLRKHRWTGMSLSFALILDLICCNIVLKPLVGRTVTSAGRPMDRLNAAEEQGGQSMGSLDMRNHLPSEVITDPISMEEAYRGSLKAMLKKNVGNYVVATFLVGTQSTTSWEGILYDVGNDYMTIYQEDGGTALRRKRDRNFGIRWLRDLLCGVLIGAGVLI